MGFSRMAFWTRIHDIYSLQVRDGLVENMKHIKLGDPTDFSTFTSAVIDDKAFQRIKGYIDHAKSNLKILSGGGYDNK